MGLNGERRMARLVTIMLLAAVAFVGVAHLALLPPWEGFDETAHWSYVQQLADTGSAPRYGVDGLSKDVTAYPGPMSYSGATPYQNNGRLTFRSYRQTGGRPIAGGPSRYVSDREANWQAQHPSLYYALMAPFYRLGHGLGWVDHLLVLRLASFALAFAGLVIGVLGASRFYEGSSIGVWAGPLMAAWPFLFPQFFPEFARLGNDSLCLLLTSIAWVLTLRLFSRRGGWVSAVGLGLALGAGLLTKAFFLPISAGIGALLALRWWTTGRLSTFLAQVVIVGVIAAAVGGWWYLARAMQTGSITGADEMIRLNKSGGLSQLIDGFSFEELAQGLILIVTTFVWAGTWSLASLPPVLLLAPVLLLGLILWNYAWSLRRADLLAWAPVIMAAPMAAGLIYHVFVWMAGAGAATPGWYFHILAAPLGLAVIRGWTRPRILVVLAGATGLFSVVAWAFQLSMFSGCAAKLGENDHYDFTGGGCFIDADILRVLGRPGFAAVCLTVGVALALSAALISFRFFSIARKID